MINCEYSIEILQVTMLDFVKTKKCTLSATKLRTSLSKFNICYWMKILINILFWFLPLEMTLDIIRIFSRSLHSFQDIGKHIFFIYILEVLVEIQFLCSTVYWYYLYAITIAIFAHILSLHFPQRACAILLYMILFQIQHFCILILAK